MEWPWFHRVPFVTLLCIGRSFEGNMSSRGEYPVELCEAGGEQLPPSEGMCERASCWQMPSKSLSLTQHAAAPDCSLGLKLFTPRFLSKRFSNAGPSCSVRGVPHEFNDGLFAWCAQHDVGRSSKYASRHASMESFLDSLLRILEVVRWLDSPTRAL